MKLGGQLRWWTGCPGRRWWFGQLMGQRGGNFNDWDGGSLSNALAGRFGGVGGSLFGVGRGRVTKFSLENISLGHCPQERPMTFSTRGPDKSFSTASGTTAKFNWTDAYSADVANAYPVRLTYERV